MPRDGALWLYEANEEPLHLVCSTRPIWPIKGWEGLLGYIEEIVRRGRVRGFIPWLITQRPAVVHKDVLSASRHPVRDETDREPGSRRDRRLDRGPGRPAGRQAHSRRSAAIATRRRLFVGPGHSVFDRVSFPAIRTFDSSRTPKRGERLVTPRTIAEVDLTAIMAALAAAETEDQAARPKDDRHAALERELAALRQRISLLDEENRALNSRLAEIAALAAGTEQGPVPAVAGAEARPRAPRPVRLAPTAEPASANGIHPAARKLLTAAAQHAPGGSPGGSSRCSPASSPAGGISMPGARSYAPPAILPKRTVWAQRHPMG
jgi:hypothetical protein